MGCTWVESGPSKTSPRISDGSMTSYVLREGMRSITGIIADDWTMHEAERVGAEAEISSGSNDLS